MLDLTTSLLVEIGGWPAMKEARGLVERGKVSQVAREGPVIRARVQGVEKVHEPQITLADRIASIDVSCTCAEFRRAGRVCPHILAAGLAAMKPFGHADQGSGTAPAFHDPEEGRSSTGPKLQRYLLEDAPPGVPQLELTFLLPLHLPEALIKGPFRVIIEARRASEDLDQPFDPMVIKLKVGFAVSEADDKVLTALEASGAVAGINILPQTRVDSFLRSLSGHPRVWLGKKQRIDVRAVLNRPQLTFSTAPDGGLIIEPDAPAATPVTTTRQRWQLEGHILREAVPVPSGFSSGPRLIPPSHIPDFLTHDFPALERQCDLAFAPGFAEFQLGVGHPEIEARLEGALSGLTLELSARYGEKSFALLERNDPADYQRYFPEPGKINAFMRRNILAERAALAIAQGAGFGLTRSGATSFSLTQENNVARFLANGLRRWRQKWTVTLGSRLTQALGQMDIAEPEFALRSGSGEDWLGLDLKLAVGGEPVPLEAAEIQRWLQTGQAHARLPNKRVLLLPTEAWGEMREVLSECEVDQEPGRMLISRRQVPYLAGALTAQGFHHAGRPALETLRDVMAEIPSTLRAQLRPYQAQGIQWLAGLAQQDFHGLLADDMGLGKTLQALAFAAWLRARPDAILAQREGGAFSASPILVVCPTSLVTNWLREAARFTPHLRGLDLTGADRTQKFSQRGSHDLLVTSYAILRRDIEQYRSTHFALVILDEAQHIKNRGSQNAQAAKALRAKHRLILTGTPLENSVLDLWSLYDFLLPGYLGTAADFRERYETPLTKAPEPRVMERLRHRVRPFFLRRTKEEVLTELPPKLDFLTLCELSDEQREVYRAVLAQGRREVFEHSGKAAKGRDRIAVLTTLLRLRQVCCHLDLLPSNAADVEKSGAATGRWKEPSAKMARTFELIDEAIDGGHRVLLFSQFVRVLHLLRDEAKRRDLRFCYLDGQTTERQEEVDRFQRDDTVPLFLISLKAGGTGLNLTGADTVIHFDPWWNPAVEEQATSRAHRMGQSRRVQAYKLIAAGTVEEKIQALQARKRELFTASLASDETFVEKLTGDELEELLAV